MLLKDNLCTRGIETTCSSRMLRGFVPTYDAAVTERLRDAGAVLLGKGNMDEFAMGSSTENSAFHPTRNPWDTSKVPGGSSGGPAAAVSAGQCVFSLGSDTGGSVRQPASLCGIVGLKPTYGLVSRYGLVAFASSLDQIGPLTTTVEDAATALGAIAGHDPRDSTSIDAPVPGYARSLEGGIAGMRIGVPKEYFVPGMEPGVEQAVRAAIDVLSDPGRERGGDLAAQHPERPRRLLHHRALGGVREPRPLRRRQVRLLAHGSGKHVGTRWRSPGRTGSGRRSSAGSCWARTPYPRATTTPTT